MINKKFICVIAAILAVSLVSACDNEKTKTTPGNDSDKTIEQTTAEIKDGDKFPPLKTQIDSASSKGNVENATFDSIPDGAEYLSIKFKDYDEPIVIKLYPELEPDACRYIAGLAKQGFYEGKNIHRVIKDFMIQGGSKNGDGLSSSSEPEFAITQNAKMRHFYGAFCMANNQSSNGSQFYIVNNKDKNVFSEYELTSVPSMAGNASYAKQYSFAQSITEEQRIKYNAKGGVPFLDGGYTVFGQTVSGFETLDAISEVECELGGDGAMSAPITPVVVENINVLTK